MQFLFNTKAPGEKKRLLAAFENFAQQNHLPDEIRKRADLALEEAITNILSYGYADNSQHTIAADFTIRDRELIIEITDDAKPFDPTKHPTPDLTIPADKRKIGGLGIHMIRQSMDTLNYQRIEDRNVLRMVKRL